MHIIATLALALMPPACAAARERVLNLTPIAISIATSVLASPAVSEGTRAVLAVALPAARTASTVYHTSKARRGDPAVLASFAGQAVARGLELVAKVRERRETREKFEAATR